jgi:hypothetical protein
MFMIKKKCFFGSKTVADEHQLAMEVANIEAVYAMQNREDALFQDQRRDALGDQSE